MRRELDKNLTNALKEIPYLSGHRRIKLYFLINFTIIAALLQDYLKER